MVDLPAFRIDATAVTNAAYGEFIGDGGYQERRHWSDAGWEWLRDERAEAPLTWVRNGAGFVRRRFGRIEADPGPRAGPARLLLRGRGVRELGGPPPPERGRVGEGGDLDAAGREARAALGRRATCRPREHRAHALRTGARRRLSGRREPMGLPRDARRRLGVDVFSLHRLSGLLGVPLPRVLRGVLRRRLPRPARRLVGDAPATSRARRSATGTTPSAARSSAGSAPLATPEPTYTPEMRACLLAVIMAASLGLLQQASAARANRAAAGACGRAASLPQPTAT